MNKININLYPRNLENNKGFAGILEQFFPQVFLGGVIMLLVNASLYFLTGLFATPFLRLEKQWKDIEPKAKVYEQIKKEGSGLESKYKRYQQLFSSRAQVSRLMAQIYQALPQNVWFEKVSYSNGVLSFSGYVVRWREDYMVSLDNFVKGLKQSDYFFSEFKRIEPKSNRKVDYNGMGVVRFEVECRKG